jgi:60 kDa SS-A/Ro ribonucleoprotein
MTASYSSFLARRRRTATIPVSQALYGRQQVRNSAGGFVFKLDKWKQLDRFLILGAAGPTYYAGQEKLVKDNADIVIQCIRENGRRVVDRIVEISDAGRAVKNDPAIFALAMVTAHGDEAAKALAFRSLSKVARTGTHLFHFCENASDLRGWGRGLQRAVAGWLCERKPESLANQVVKYRQRDGWSMRDVLRVSHPRQHYNLSEQQNAIFHYVTKGWESVGDQPHPDKALVGIWAAERAKRATGEKEIARLVRDYALPWEAIDTKWLKSNVVWEALLENIKPAALVRNLNRLTANGYIKDFSQSTRDIVTKLTNPEYIKGSRLHPFSVLVALKQYGLGHGDKGSLVWRPNQQVVNALDELFYMTHQFVEPTGKNILVAVDVSGSMDSNQCAKLPMTARDVAVAMAMTIAKTEPNHKLVAISGGLTEMAISPRQRLDDVINYTRRLPFQQTDLSLPMVTALQRNWEVDAFVTITDGEVNAGTHPSAALEQYRRASGREGRNVVIAVTSTGFTIADPNDHRSLDVVGMDTAVPQLVSDFIAGRLM